MKPMNTAQIIATFQFSMLNKTPPFGCYPLRENTLATHKMLTRVFLAGDQEADENRPGNLSTAWAETWTLVSQDRTILSL